MPVQTFFFNDNNHRVVFKVIQGNNGYYRCEFGCYDIEPLDAVPPEFQEAGWRLDDDNTTLRKEANGQGFKFTISSLNARCFLIKPYSPNGRNQGKPRQEFEVIYEKFKNEVRNSGIGDIFCQVFPDERANRLNARLVNNQNDFELCDDNVLNHNDIVNILREVFPVDISDILRERYRIMQNMYLIPWENGDGQWQQNSLDIVKSQGELYHDALLKVPIDGDKWNRLKMQLGLPNDASWGSLASFCNLGHDLPVWCYYNSTIPNGQIEQARRVMIVSQDPLRNGFGPGQLLLSTPWGLHSRNYLWDCHELSQRVIHTLLERGAIVYITDFYKLYGTHPINALRQNCPRRTDQRLNEFKATMKQVLQEEINLFSPNYIFIYGDEVRDDLNINDNNGNQNFEICLNIPEHCDDYPVPHTSAWGVSFNQTYLPIINEILPLIQP